jgi:PleD family two-component response regulator
MPVMDCFELTKRIRSTYNKEELAIIGMSTYGNQSLSAKFIKTGANDFLNKPFFKEEFYCRVT